MSDAPPAVGQPEPSSDAAHKTDNRGMCLIKPEYVCTSDWAEKVGECYKRLAEVHKPVIDTDNLIKARQAVLDAEKEKEEAERLEDEERERERLETEKKRCELRKKKQELGIEGIPDRRVCCLFIQGETSKKECTYGDTCKFSHDDDGMTPCQYGARCVSGHAYRDTEIREKRPGDNIASSKRQKSGRGMNRGKARMTTRVRGTGCRPTWDGEVNFMKSGFPKKWRNIVSANWRCEEAKITEGKWCDPKEKKHLDWKNKLYLSPLTTVGNLPFRRICTQFGADITCSEMAVADNLIRFQSSEWSLLRKHESEKNFGIQIAAKNGNEAEWLGKILADTDFDYDFVDVNCGCPVDLMTDRGMGAALGEQRNREKLKGIVKGLHYQPKPVTIKVRIGYDERNPTLHTWIDQIDQWGVEAITVHGRSKRQRYSRLADWKYIYSCSQKCNVPVIGNGDLLDYSFFHDKLESGDISSIMTGRGALMKPWVFTEVKERRHWDISSSERFDILKEFCKVGMDHWGADLRGIATTRRFLCEWLSFLCRYVPVGLLETIPQKHNERPQAFIGRDDLETLMGSDRSSDWVKISELLLGPVEPGFVFTPKHKSSAYTVAKDGKTTITEDENAKIELE